MLASIKTLNLSGLNMRSVPKEIGLFKNLRSLTLSNNRLTNLPDELGHLKKLEMLDLNRNQLTALPLCICSLRSLIHLTVCHNQLETLPVEISCLSHLQLLFLGDNRLSTLPDSIGALKFLFCLSVDQNRLISLPSSIGKLYELSSLFLYDNQISTLPVTIKGLKKLRVLSLACNRLKNVPEELGSLCQLETLLLSHNALEELPRSFGGMESLQMLFVDGNQLKSLPAELQSLENLVNVAFDNNPFETFPELERIPFWLLDFKPHLHPEKMPETPAPNEDICDQKLQSTYFQLGKNKWKECIDREFHMYGSEVFDKGLHGKAVEPGFLAGMFASFEFLAENMKRKIDAAFYLELHSIACSHFIGEEGGTEVDLKDVGVFRDSKDKIEADFFQEEYPFSADGIKEFYELSNLISSHFGPMFSLGRIAPLKRGKAGKRIEYHRMSSVQVKMIFDFFVSEFYDQMAHALSPKQKLKAIARLIQRLEWLHPPCDGCGRTDTALLNFLLTRYGSHPVILTLPYRSSCRGLKEWIEILEEGLSNWEREVACELYRT